MTSHGYLLGIDIGSSSIKASLVSIDTGEAVSSAQSPPEEMPIVALQPGWAEQDPEMWWKHTIICVKDCLTKGGIRKDEALAIGISYQMHGLVCVDKSQTVLRPSIIWCDSRAVKVGEEVYNQLGQSFCLDHLLNSPGNFTASKLKWVKDNEPSLFKRIHKVMLPGDYIAMRLTGEIATTASGLSEGIFWDYKKAGVSSELMDCFGFDKSILGNVVPTFSVQGNLTRDAAEEIGLTEGTPIAYRAGDQPNNAFSLNVLAPGEVAATAGTSGVIYSVTDKNACDLKSRVNTFVHVNNSLQKNEARNGVLLCVNGTGILNSWLRKNFSGMDYESMNSLAGQVPIGSEGLIILPFGNGAERVLENRNFSASFQGLSFTTHHQSHVFRAAQEGIVFALKYGFAVLEEMGLTTNVIRAGHANMFLSPVFREAFVNTMNVRLELYDTNGARGAALGAGIGSGLYSSIKEAFGGLRLIRSVEPELDKVARYQKIYTQWHSLLTEQY